MERIFHPGVAHFKIGSLPFGVGYGREPKGFPPKGSFIVREIVEWR
jgi:hypothetical protein